MSIIDEISRSLDRDLVEQDFAAVLHKTSYLLRQQKPDFRLVIFRAVALNALGRRQDALKLMLEFVRLEFNRDVLISLSQTILGQGAPYGEVLFLRDVFNLYESEVRSDLMLLRFRAEAEYHLGNRTKALAEMHQLPPGTVPDHYFQSEQQNSLLSKLVESVHVGDSAFVRENFERVHQSVTAGSVDDYNLVAIVGRLERLPSVRAQLKRSLSYEISGAKIDPSRHLVIETMLYAGEEHILDLHLNSMPFVDHFIIVQGNRSFTGKSKDIYRIIDNPRFYRFKDKITTITLNFMEFDDPLLKFAWFVEALHRNAAHATVLAGRDGDVHIISDVDEVIRQEALEKYRAACSSIAAVCLREHKFFLNFQYFGVGDSIQTTLPTLTTICAGSTHASADPQTIRNFIARDPARRSSRIIDGGWHFSSVVGANELMAKYRNYSHVENTAKNNDAFFFADFVNDLKTGSYRNRDADYYSTRGLSINGYAAMPIIAGMYPDILAREVGRFDEFVMKSAGVEEISAMMQVMNRRSG